MQYKGTEQEQPGTQAQVQNANSGSIASSEQTTGQGNVAAAKPLPESSQLVETAPSPELALATYLSQSGAVLYDAENCPYCRKQQRLFGPGAFQQLRVVNCGPWSHPYPECRHMGIRTFPTWELGGKRYPTILPLAELAAISGFDRSHNMETADRQGGAQ